MDHPYYAITDANGGYSLRDIPPGTYALTMWHEGVTPIDTLMENGRPKSFRFEESYETTKQVTVQAGGNVRMDFELVLRASTDK
jgi:hypothetical protein